MRKRRSHRWARVAVGVSLAVLGGAILTAGATAPELIETAWGTVRSVAVTAPHAVTGTLPDISLGRSGTAEDLDACDGTFTEMLAYESEDTPPVWAAHNNCGGDAILPWVEGQQFRISGELYEVIEIRQLPKYTSAPEDLAGLSGDISLQTCVYGKPVMTFVGAIHLSPAD